MNKTTPYESPSLKVAGTLHDVTLVTNKYETHTPDGVILHPGHIALTS